MDDIALVTNQLFDLDVLTDITAGFLDGALIYLYKSDTPATKNVVLGDLTTANFTGAAGKAITWGAPTVNDLGDVEMVGTVAAAFKPTDAVTPNDIYGAYIRLAGPADLVAIARFENAPLPMNSALDQLLPVIRVRLTQSGVIVVIS